MQLLQNRSSSIIIERVLSSNDLFLRKAMEAVNNHLTDHTFDFERFAGCLEISKSTLYRRLISSAGISPCEFVNQMRLEKALQLLGDKSFNISEIAYHSGYGCPHYFSQCFKVRYGVLPSQYRSKLSKSSGGNISAINQDFIEKMTSLIEENILDSEYDYSRLAQDLNLSLSSLYRRIKQVAGKSPGIFMRTVKLNYSRNLLENNMEDIPEVALISGFNDVKYFSKCFRSEFGISPREFIKMNNCITRVAI